MSENFSELRFFYVKDNQKIGPLSYSELLESGINRDALIWTKELETWTRFSESRYFPIDEDVPPPLPFENVQKQEVEPPAVPHKEIKLSSLKNFKTKKIFIGVFIFIVGAFTILTVAQLVTNVFKKNQSGYTQEKYGTGEYISPSTSSTTPSTYRPPKPSLTPEQQIMQQERARPSSNFSVHASARVNFANEHVFEGYFINNAKYSAFKDIKLRVQFYSVTDKLLVQQDFDFYSYYYPNAKQNFKKKVKTPRQSSYYTINVVSATPYN
jgi:hypothetical protein